MTYVSSDGTGDPQPKEGPSGIDPYEEIEGVPHHHYYVPIKGNPPVSHFKPIREELTPRRDSMGVVVEIPQWEEQYGTKTYGVDRRYGIIYAVKDGEWGRFVKACNCFPQKEIEEGKDGPIAGLKSPQEVQTPKSQDEVPLAESTRKKNKFSRVTIKDLGASHSDLNTVGFSESSTDIATSSDDTAKIQQEIEETEKANKALEEERLKIERERMEMAREQHEIAKQRLIEVKGRREEVIAAMIKESEALAKQREITSQLRKQRRGEIYKQIKDQLEKEEQLFEEYLEGLEPNYASSEVLSHETDFSSEWSIPEVGEEPKVALMWAGHAKMLSHLNCLRQEHNHMNDIGEATVGTHIQHDRRKKRIQKKLEDINNTIHKYMTKEEDDDRQKYREEIPRDSLVMDKDK